MITIQMSMYRSAVAFSTSHFRWPVHEKLVPFYRLKHKYKLYDLLISPMRHGNNDDLLFFSEIPQVPTNPAQVARIVFEIFLLVG